MSSTNATIATAVLLAAIAVGWQPATAAEESKAKAKTTFEEHVRPIFREHCFSCHNQQKARNDLAVDTYEKLMEGGASGEVIEPGEPDSSYLWMLVNHDDEPAMPPAQDKLSAAKLEVIKRWIAGGALKDAGSKAKVVKRPGLDMAITGGAKRPEGPAILPEGLSRQPIVYTARPAAATALASSPWAPLVAVAGQNQISLYNSDSSELFGVLPFPEGIAQSLRFSRSGSLLLAGGGRDAAQGLAVVYDVKTGRRMFDVGDELDTVLASDINQSQTLIALGGPQRVVRVFSTADGQLAYQLDKHTDWILALEFSPDGILLATADRAGGLMVWEADTGREYANLLGHKKAVTGVSWRSDSNVLASASEDGTVKLWDMETSRQLKSVNAHSGGALAVAFTHDGRITTAGRDKLVKIWDGTAKQLRALPSFAEPAMEVTFTHDGQRVVAGDWSGLIRMSNAADGAEVSRLPSNPPTLELRLKAAQELAATAQQAAAKATAELDAAEKRLTQAKTAAEAAAKQSAAAVEAAKSAQQKAATARKAAAQAKGEDKKALQKAASDADQAAKQAAEQLTAAKQSARKAAAAVADPQKARDAKAAAAEAARKAAAEAQAAVGRALAEKEAFDKAPKSSG